jgi:hypothetical protein
MLCTRHAYDELHFNRNISPLQAFQRPRRTRVNNMAANIHIRFAIIIFTILSSSCIFQTNSDPTDLETFLLRIPHLAGEATRLQHSTNINVIELMQRRLEDSTCVINTLIRRLCERQPRDCHEVDLQQQLRALQHYLWTMLEHFRNLGFRQTNAADTSYRSPTLRRGGPGRPSYEIDGTMVSDLFNIHRSWSRVSTELGISYRTLLRRRLEFGMDISASIGQRVTYTNITEDDLCNAIGDVLRRLPDVGETYVFGMYIGTVHYLCG